MSSLVRNKAEGRRTIMPEACLRHDGPRCGDPPASRALYLDKPEEDRIGAHTAAKSPGRGVARQWRGTYGAIRALARRPR